ncbi:MAG: phosphate ABC transporter substrate-binding protein [Acidobacteriota bacterium]
MSKQAIVVLGLAVMVGTPAACKRPEQKGGAAGLAALQIKGSDTMVNLGQAWAQEFTKGHPEANVAVTGGGSGTGIAALINGTADICESSRVMEAKELTLAAEKGVSPREHIVALDGLAVIVHPSNPVSRLTIAQLRDIFMGRLTDWKDVGGNPGTIVVLSREVNSGTHVFFKEHVLRMGNAKGAEEFAPSALLMPSSQAIADEAAQNPQAIGYYGMGYISPSQKVIAVAKTDKDPYVAPATSSVLDNSYPISRPLYLYTNGEPKGLVKEFVDFAFSAEGQAVVSKIEFVPIKRQS